jgi:hypothetical protein
MNDEGAERAQHDDSREPTALLYTFNVPVFHSRQPAQRERDTAEREREQQTAAATSRPKFRKKKLCFAELHSSI